MDVVAQTVRHRESMVNVSISSATTATATVALCPNFVVRALIAFFSSTIGSATYGGSFSALFSLRVPHNVAKVSDAVCSSSPHLYRASATAEATWPRKRITRTTWPLSRGRERVRIEPEHVELNIAICRPRRSSVASLPARHRLHRFLRVLVSAEVSPLAV